MLTCPVCNELNWSKALRIRRATLSSCGGCGLLATTSHLAGGQSIDALYDVSAKERREYEADYLPSRLASFRKLLPLLEGFRENSRLLEIGSGYGHFLNLACNNKWVAEGIEISTYASTVARDLGCNIHNIPLDQLDATDNSFDVVIMWDVIEHFEHPRQIVSACAKLLRKGGALVLKTPDARALTSLSGPIQKVYQQLVYPANTAEHIFHFTPRVLEQMLRLFGFGMFSVDDRDDWNEKVISGRNKPIRLLRRAIMAYAHARSWPYEFVMTAIKQ